MTFPNLHSAPEEEENLSTTNVPTEPTSNTSTATNKNTNRVTNSEDVISALSHYHLSFTQSSYTESADISTCYTHPNTPVADLLLDALTASYQFRQSASPNVFKQVMEFLKTNTRVEKSTNEGDDKVYFDTESDILVVSKIL